uniref:PABS domain-containing protein n=1 Tax=Gongylonema pulchrum TaxID=637853 RepID=A0A183ED14_9BILA
LLFYVSLSWPVFEEDRSYAHVAEDQQARYIIEFERCSDVTGNCYTVYDTIDVFTGDVNRFLIADGYQEGHETAVRLIPPAGIKSEQSDSRFWRVNHTHIHSQYVAVMLTAPFALSSLSLSSDQQLNAKILIIGLGGGSMHMFLTSQFPKITVTGVELDPVVVELARRWFGLAKNSSNVRIITMDGVEYIKKAAKRKELFNVVLIDACTKRGILACPSDPFTLPNFLNSVMEILEPTGVVVVNILSHDDSSNEVDEGLL